MLTETEQKNEQRLKRLIFKPAIETYVTYPAARATYIRGKQQYTDTLGTA